MTTEKSSEHTKPDLLDLARGGANAWADWRRSNPLLQVDLAPIYTALLDGQVEKPSAELALVLAKAGPELWNAWRDKHFSSEVNFEGREFDWSSPDFAHFQLRSAKFAGARFPKDAVFTGALLDDADFSATIFERSATFTGVFSFAKGVRFTNATFCGKTSFDAASLYAAVFDGATFGCIATDVTGDSEKEVQVSFRGTQFRGGSSFRHTYFGSHLADYGGALRKAHAVFVAAQFSDQAIFDGSVFRCPVSFDARSPEYVRKYWDSTARRLISAYHGNPRAFYFKRKSLKEEQESFTRIREELAAQDDISSNAFKEISFAGVLFRGEANFEGRVFRGVTNFGRLPPENAGHVRVRVTGPSGIPDIIREVVEAGKPACFRVAPKMHNCEMYRDTNIVEAKFEDLSERGAVAAYRSLKQAMNKQLATREEQHFFRLEMKAEEQQTTGVQRRMLQAYRWTSDYGLSVGKPAGAIALLWLFNLLALGLLQSPLALPRASVYFDGSQFATLLVYSVLHILPVPGLDEAGKQLFAALYPHPGPLWPSVFAAWSAFAKTASLILFFLFGLGLRNQFKLK